MVRWLLIGAGVVAALVAGVLVVGMMLPESHTATVAAEYPVPPELVWSAITEVDAFPQWRRGVTRVEVLEPAEEGGPPRRWRETGEYGPMTLEVVEMEPGRRLVARIADQGLPYGGTWTYRAEPVPGGTRLTITEDGEVYSPLFRFMSRFVFGHESTLRDYHEDLRERL